MVSVLFKYDTRKQIFMTYSYIFLNPISATKTAFLTTRQIPTTFKTVSTTQNNIQKNYFSLSSTTNPEETKRLPLCKGSYVAIVTPFTPTGSVDLDAMRKLLKYHLDGGTDGICVLGTTGESATLSMSEREGKFPSDKFFLLMKVYFIDVTFLPL